MMNTLDTQALLLIKVIMAGALVEGLCELLKWNKLIRIRNIVFGALSLAAACYVASLPSSQVQIVQGTPPLPYLELVAVFKGAETFSVCALLLYVIAVTLVPRHVLKYMQFSGLLLSQVMVLTLAHITTGVLFLLLLVSTVVMLMVLYRVDARSIRDDVRGELREQVFMVFKTSAVLLLSYCVAIRVLGNSLSPEVTAWLSIADVVCLFVSSSLLIGLFPFHGWVVPFFGAPRATVFLPLLCLETAIIVFFRLYVPLVERFGLSTQIFIWMPIAGLLYSSLLFFGEERLKRIPGYLYLSHISLMALSVIGFGQGDITAPMLDSVNVMLACAGLLVVTSLLTARLGAWAVARPAGLAATFPELGVCYLICTLSLVGFPGTLGFTEEEVMLGQGITDHLGLVTLITFGLTLNGFSAFRLFARLFYGQSILSPDPAMAIKWRERVALLTIIILIVVNGVVPSFLVGLVTRSH